MKKKNILYLTVRSDIGGGPIHLNELIMNSEMEKINIFVACPFLGTLYQEKWQFTSKIQSLIKIPYRRFSLFAFFRLLNYIKRNNIDIIHSHGKGAGVYSRLLTLFILDVKVIHTFHGLGKVKQGNVIQLIKNVYLEKILVRFTDFFISVSEGEKNIAISLLGIDKEKIKMIHNGVHDTFNSKKREGSRQVVTFSRFSHEKNMLASYEILNICDKNIKFVWVGDGDDFNEILRRKENDNCNNLILCGLQTDTSQYLVPGSVYLSTSRYEGLPLALLEALANGIPIIATDVVGNNEVVREDYNGYLFPEGNIQLAAEKIGLLFRNDCLYDRISKNARLDYLDRFTIDKMMISLNKVYDEVYS